MNNYNIKSVIRKIYAINYSNINLQDRTELIISNKTNDFHQLLFMNNEETNTYLIPSYESDKKSTQTGLFYNNKTIYNHSTYGDDLISFRLSLTGIRNKRDYRIRFILSPFNEYGENKSTKAYIILNGKDIIYNKEVTEEKTVIDYIHSANETVINLAITIGKVAIHDIIIEEVELSEQLDREKETVDVPDLMNLKAYAVIKPSLLKDRSMVINKYPIIRGIGLNILNHKDTGRYIVERNKENDVIQDNIGSTNYLIDVKSVNGGTINTITSSTESSHLSNTKGYYTFKADDVNDETIITILIYELL